MCEHFYSKRWFYLDLLWLKCYCQIQKSVQNLRIPKSIHHDEMAWEHGAGGVGVDREQEPFRSWVKGSRAV